VDLQLEFVEGTLEFLLALLLLLQTESALHEFVLGNIQDFLVLLPSQFNSLVHFLQLPVHTLQMVDLGTQVAKGAFEVVAAVAQLRFEAVVVVVYARTDGLQQTRHPLHLVRRKVG
jgi:hypothetical protein